MKWRGSVWNEQRTAQGELDLPLLAYTLEVMEMGGQERVTQFTVGFPITGEVAEPGVYPEHPCPDPELGPHPAANKCEIPD